MMGSTVYVLIMLFGGSTSQSGMTVVQQEFNNYQSCEVARKELAKAHNRSMNMVLRAQGCFKK